MAGRRFAEGAPRKDEQELQRFVLAQLLREDPLNLNYGGGAAVYGPDANAITDGLWDCRSEAEVCSVVYQRLQDSFGTEAVGCPESYLPMARAIWSFAGTRSTESK